MKISYKNEICKKEIEEAVIEVDGWYDWDSMYYVFFLNEHYVFKVNHTWLGGFSVESSRWALKDYKKMVQVLEQEVRDVNPSIVDSILPFIKSYFSIEQDHPTFARKCNEELKSVISEMIKRRKKKYEHADAN